MKYLIGFLFIALFAHGTPCGQVAQALTDYDRQEFIEKNMLADKNAGFESGISQWSGTPALVKAAGGNILFGKGSATWDSTSAGQTLSSASGTMPNGLLGQSCEASILTAVPSGTATHNIQAFVGTDIISVPIFSSVTPRRQLVIFPCPSVATTIRIRIQSVAANEPLIAMDDGYIGIVKTIGVSEINTNGVSYTPTYTGLGTVANSVGKWWQVGKFIRLQGSGTAGTTSGSTFSISLPAGVCNVDTSTAVSNLINAGWTTATFALTANITNGAQLQYRTSTGLIEATNKADGSSTNNLVSHSGTQLFSTGNVFSWYALIPCSNFNPSLALSPNQQGLSWSGYHDSTCSWARTNAAFGDPAADASCGFFERTNRNFGVVSSVLSGGNKLPGILFTPKESGRYQVCFTTQITGGGTQYAGAAVQLVSLGGTVITMASRQMPSTFDELASASACGIADLSAGTVAQLYLQTRTSTGTVRLDAPTAGLDAVNWSIFALDQPSRALLANSVSSNVVNGAKIVWAKVATTCSSSPCAIADSSGDVTSITRSSLGLYVVNFAAGTWATAPTCTYRCMNASNLFYGDGATGSETTTQMFVGCYTSSATVNDAGLRIQCMGPR